MMRPTHDYDAGLLDGQRHASQGKPLLASPGPYGVGFFDGWKLVAYGDGADGTGPRRPDASTDDDSRPAPSWPDPAA